MVDVLFSSSAAFVSPWIHSFLNDDDDSRTNKNVKSFYDKEKKKSVYAVSKPRVYSHLWGVLPPRPCPPLS